MVHGIPCIVQGCERPDTGSVDSGSECMAFYAFREAINTAYLSQISPWL
jgi:hypothetical protein